MFSSLTGHRSKHDSRTSSSSSSSGSLARRPVKSCRKRCQMWLVSRDLKGRTLKMSTVLLTKDLWQASAGDLIYTKYKIFLFIQSCVYII